MGASRGRRGRPKHSSEIALTGTRPLDRGSSIPLYFQLGEILKEKLESGVWPPGTVFPSEREIEEQFGATRAVIRPALDLLEADGAIVRVRGSGTFVSPPKRRVPISGLIEALAGSRAEGPELLVLSTREKCRDQTVADALSMADRSRLAQVTAVLRFEQPVYVIDSFFSATRVPWLLGAARSLQGGEQPRVPGGLKLTRAQASIESSSFGRWAAAQLGVSAGDPALVARLVQYGMPPGRKRERPLELARIVSRSDIAQLGFEMS